MEPREAETAFDHPMLGRTTLPRMLEDSADRHADGGAQAYKGGVYDRTLSPEVVPMAPDGQFATLSYGELQELVRRLATGFRELGVGPDDRVAIYAHTRMEWAQCDFALLAAGGVVTTVYPGSSTRQVRYLLDDAGADAAVVEGREELDNVVEVADEVDLNFVVTMDEVGGMAEEAPVDVYTLAEVYETGDAAWDRDAYEAMLSDRDPSDLASLIYTSGTTGRPKGVRLTHWNFRANVNQCFRRFGPRPDRDTAAIDSDARTVSFLPLAHVFERLAGHFMMVAAGAQVAYAETPDTIREDFGLVSPTVGTSVPRVYEKLYEAIREQASESALRQRIFEWATDVGRDYHTTDRPGPLLRAQASLADRLVFQKVHEALGGELDFLISGGGSLSADLCALYHGMGLPILEGYGLTETSPVVSANPPEAPQIGTIGPPVVDCEIRVDDAVVPDDMEAEADGDVGELLVRGPQVTDGYWNLPDATGRAFDEDPDGGDPWFRTGDVVELRPDGYLAFRERVKEILNLSTGKMVPPGPIEDAFVGSSLVEQCMVVGEDRKFVSALIVPNEEGVRKWADGRGIDLPDDRQGLCDDPRVRDRIAEVVEEVNERFEPHERIKQFRLVPEEFSEDNDLLTPTLKKKRRNILDRFDDRVEEIYAESEE